MQLIGKGFHFLWKKLLLTGFVMTEMNKLFERRILKEK